MSYDDDAELHQNIIFFWFKMRFNSISGGNYIEFSEWNEEFGKSFSFSNENTQLWPKLEINLNFSYLFFQKSQIKRQQRILVN